MKLFLIKIGKAFKTIRRDGVFKGGKRVFQAFFALFRKVGSGDILFITGGVGDSARYRTHHVAEELELHGFKCSITVQDNPLLSKYADKFKIFIFHRVLFTPSVAKLVAKIKTQNKEIIFETDDLVYDPQYLQYMDYFKQMNVFERKLYENGVGGEILADDYVKVCTTTTSFLAQKLREKNKKVFIVPNKLSTEDLQTVDKILKNQKQKTKNQKLIKLGYFSGALSHNKDFATITEALLRIMEKYSQVILFLAGPLDIDSELNKFKDRIEQLSYVPRNRHFENVASVDINIAPLEIGNPFCEGKSELKFFEAGIVKVPTVAAATQTFKEAIEDGVDGFTASTNQEWFDKIEKLILDEKLRCEMGEKAREKALRVYNVKNSNDEEYYNYLKSKLN
ncbi:MAG: glycosyltransferase [Parcubacteria group bacterium]|jgi:glycosyltransferase involved in cell wall biosynthesis